MEQERKSKTCKRCGYEWFSRVEHPRVCPKCFSPRWDKDRTKITRTPEEKTMRAGDFRAAIERSGLTKREIAEKIGKSTPTVSLYARGDIYTPDDVLAAVQLLMGWPKKIRRILFKRMYNCIGESLPEIAARLATTPEKLLPYVKEEICPTEKQLRHMETVAKRYCSYFESIESILAGLK